MSTLRVWLIRHGESELNAGIMTDNPQGSVLTEKGKAQAHSVAERVEEKPSLIISSPAIRAVDTAKPICERWPASAYDIWPIQEWVYLDPHYYFHANSFDRKQTVFSYWDKLDTHFSHENKAETFAQFIARVSDFHEKLLQLHGFVVVVGHGMFFSAYLTCLEHGFQPTRELMALFRENEKNAPLKNGQIIKMDLENSL